MSHHDFHHLTEGNERIALVADSATYTYGEVNSRIDRFATGLLGGRSDLEEERIAFFLPASLDYVTCMHGVWRAGGIAVPLNVASAVAELDHYLSSATGHSHVRASGSAGRAARALRLASASNC